MNDKAKTDETSTGTFKVTVKARMYHGELFAAMKRYGMSQKRLADYLGTNINVVGQMLRLQKIPNFSTRCGIKIRQRLEELTELSILELFPDHIFTEGFLRRDKTVEVTKEVPANLLTNAAAFRERPMPPDQKLIEKETGDEAQISEVLKTLGELDGREQLVIRMRYFDGKTLEQAGVAIGVSRARAGYVEKSALRKLRNALKLGLLQDSYEVNLINRFRKWLARVCADSPAFQKKG